MQHWIKILVLFITLHASAAQATATLVTEAGSGRLMGANGVLVEGKRYDVRFADGSCDGLGLCGTAFVFDDFFRATAAADALLEQVFRDTQTGAFDTVPFLTGGCPSEEVSCAVMIPYAMDDKNAFLIAAQNGVDDTYDDTVFNFLEARNSDTSENSGMVYAIWLPSASVPEPGTLGLFVSLGAGLLGWRRGVP